MSTINIKTKERQLRIYAIDPQDRKEAWMKIWGVWKNKKSDPIRILKQIRKGWERKTW